MGHGATLASAVRTFTTHTTDARRADGSAYLSSPDQPGLGTLTKWMKLAGLCALGICTVSIPLTVALALSATGASGVLTLGDVTPRHQHQTPAKAVANDRCVAKRGYYALTFDDGPLPATTRQLVTALAKAGAVGTFFDIGERAAAHQNLVELQRSVGQVANETYTAPDMTRVSQARRYQELQAAARVLDYPNVLFRPPFGKTSAAVEADVLHSGLTLVYWTVDAAGAGLSAAAIAERALLVAPGGIIRLAGDSAQSADAISSIVSGLARRGLCPGFVSSSKQDAVGPGGLLFHAVAVKP
jgi:peptidoglycan/xylan/chitin deacetylase (PgdA/CDA1 family)